MSDTTQVRNGLRGDVECAECLTYWPGSYDRENCRNCGSEQIQPAEFHRVDREMWLSGEPLSECLVGGGS